MVITMEVTLSCSVLNFVPKRLTDQDLLAVSLESFPAIKTAGFDCVEVYLRQVGGPEPVALGAGALRNHLEIRSVHFSKPLLNRDNPDVADELRRFVQTAAWLGASLGIIHPPTGRTGGDKGLEICRRVLDRVLPFAEAVKVILTLENVNGHGCIAMLRRLVEEFPSPSLGMTLDLKFLYASGNTMTDYFGALGSKTVNIHVNDFAGRLVDFAGKRLYPPLGQGVVDFVELGQLLQRLNYSGVLTLESSLSGGWDRSLAAAMSMMLELIGRGNKDVESPSSGG